ncbi:WD-repeats-region domain-containing protein [Favolaschia claudopus]|uniref:WD-repeats-region domain-containing protein n=1 Tax=Favolaschia claudopus TaxID=2862362 RepID=A0AAW0DWK6_9AGAR
MNPPVPSGSRKRVNSRAEEDDDARFKRPRLIVPASPIFVSPVILPPPSPSLRDPIQYDAYSVPFLARLSPNDAVLASLPNARSPSSQFSISRSRSGTSAAALRRSASLSSFHSQATEPPTQPQPHYPDGSSKFCLKPSPRLSIDFCLPSAESSSGSTALPLCYFDGNLFFGRANNRVHVRNMASGDTSSSSTSAQLCKLQEAHGDLGCLAAGGIQNDRLALSTSKGFIQIWDTNTKKMVSQWSTNGVASMVWNGNVLTTGGLKGAIRQYDTRIQPAAKMKEQAAKATNHRGRVSVLSWNSEGRLLASGDQHGAVWTWDSRALVPLDVGDFSQRRKKIQHSQAISALGWCPWQPKLLATGDIQGVVRFWNVEPANPNSNATQPTKIEFGSKVVGLTFSPNYKELLTTLGPPSNVPDNTRLSVLPGSTTCNALVSHTFPSLRPITSISVSEEEVCGSVLNTATTAHKIVVAVPGEAALKVYDVNFQGILLKFSSSPNDHAVRVELFGLQLSLPRRRCALCIDILFQLSATADNERTGRNCVCFQFCASAAPPSLLTLSSRSGYDSHGPMFLGYIYLYMTTYKRWVAVLMLADTLNTGFMIAYLYQSLVVHFDDLAYLAKANWDPAMTGIIGAMVQLFYAWRIHTLTGSVWVVGLIGVCALTNAFGGLATASAIAFVPEFDHFQQFQVTVICWLMSAAVGDVIITTTLVSFFRKHRTGCSATDSKVDQIIRLTIQTGMITSLCSVVDLGLFLGDSSGMHLLFNLPLAKLYSNSLMSSLNARGGWRRSDPNDSGDLKNISLPLSVNVPPTSTAATVDLPTPNMAQQTRFNITSAASQKSYIESPV